MRCETEAGLKTQVVRGGSARLCQGDTAEVKHEKRVMKKKFLRTTSSFLAVYVS